MKKIIALALTMSMALVLFCTRSRAVDAVEYPEIIESIDVYSQNSFTLNFNVPTNNVIDFNSLMKSIFDNGGNASWEYTFEIKFSNYSVSSFSMLLSNLWQWDSSQNYFELESDNETLLYEDYSPPNIITSQNFENRTGYVLSVVFSAFGYDLTDFVISFQNDGYSQGYNDGYNQGYINGETNGYNQGYINGETNGYNQGYQQGFLDSESNDNDLYKMILAVVDTPFVIFDYIFDFDILGINIKNIILSFTTIAVAVFVIKRFI